MAVELVLPRLGWTMEEGTFVEWLKHDGDDVHPGDLLYTIESDKSTVEVENFDAGILRIPPDAPGPGARIAVGTLLAYVVQPGEVLPFEQSNVQQKSAVHASPRARRAAKQLGVDWSALTGTGATGRVLERDVRAAATATTATASGKRATSGHLSPIAQRAAQELGVDVDALAATMPGQRIERADVERFAVAHSAHPAHPVDKPTPSAQRAPISRMRRTIADRLAATARTVVPVTLTTQADATELVRLRKMLKADAGDAPANAPGYNDMLAKIAAKALLEHPHMNARLEGDQIVTESAAHIGMAVDTERGLLVAVVRDAQAKTLRQIAEASTQVVARVRAGNASPDNVRGSTFTITNLGAFDIDAFTPVINAPECAILGVGRIALQPVIVGKKVRARHLLSLSLTFDHRLVDGAPAARFLQRIRQLVEQPYLWLVD